MKKLFKKLVLTILSCFCIVGIQAQHEGQCGDNITYRFDETTGELYLQGTGSTWWMGEGGINQPWYSFRNSIKRIYVGEGITKLNYKTFIYSEFLESILLPQTLTNIDFGNFFNCHNLRSIIIPQNVTFLGPQVFGNDWYLDTIINLSKEPQIIRENNGNYTLTFIGLKRVTYLLYQTNQ